ncbi:hypothetical protein ACET3Z_018258 [Daucus carota]
MIPGLDGVSVDALKGLLVQFGVQGHTVQEEAASPFSTAVRQSPLPATFRGTGDLRYNGTTDPTEYIGRFTTEMELHQVSDLTKCRLLASTLRGNAHQWFQKIGPGSIGSWEQMRRMFLTQFQSSIHYAPPVTTLAHIRQKEGGTLQALQRKEPPTLAALYLLAEPYKREEEALASITRHDASSSRTSRQRKKDRTPSPRKEKKNTVNALDVRPVSEERNSPPRQPSPIRRRSNIDHYTPLVASIEHIFEVNKKSGIFKKPNPLTPTQVKDKKKFCAYHESHGHDTHECRQLKEEIEQLIRNGKLTDWVVRERPPKLFKGEDTQIIYSEEDARWVHHPHADALVVNVRIGSRNVHRVFVDNGSSVNLLYYSTFQKMGLLDKDMTRKMTYLYGFTGDAVRVKGTIRLPVTLGEDPVSATQVAEFMIVEAPAYYNALIGRPILKDMRVVTSIYHLSMKFPTPRGVGCIKGCQYDSRDCYNRTIKTASKFKADINPDEEMLDFKEENAEETKRSFRPLRFTKASTNMIYTVQFPEEENPQKIGWEEEKQKRLEWKETETTLPNQTILQIEGPPPMPSDTFIEGIVEEASEDETEEQKLMRARKGKMVIDDPALHPSDYPRLPPFEGESSKSANTVHPKVDDDDLRDVDLDPRLPETLQKVGPAEDTAGILVDENDATKVLFIGIRLDNLMRRKMVDFLKSNLDVFAWSHADMT